MAQVKKENREQTLVDICFEIAMVAAKDKHLRKATNEQIANWVAQQLSDCGFKVEACGSSWGVLVENNDKNPASGFTFEKTSDLFGEDVIMVLRNRDKKHIITINKEHKKKMNDLGYDFNRDNDILLYLKQYALLK